MSFKCDKCGKEVQYIKYIYDTDGSEIPAYYSYTIDLADGKDFYNYELCEECYNKIKEILDNADEGLNSSGEESNKDA